MKRNYFNKTKVGLKALIVGLLLTGANSTEAQCIADYTFTTGPNGSVSFMSTSSGTTASTAYFWNFGGSNVLGGPNATHTYTSNGYKTVCLTIYSNTTAPSSCSATVCDTVWITNVTSSVTPCAPSVVYTLSKDSVQALTWNAFPVYPANITNATWSWGDGNTTVGLYPSHTYSAAGTYSTCVTISVSCGTVTATYCYVASIFRSSESKAMISLNVKKSGATGIGSQTKEESQLSIYPNPNNGEFILELKGGLQKENTVTVYNMMGQKVAEKQILSESKQAFDLSHLANGTYLVKIDSEKGSAHKKITIQK